MIRRFLNKLLRPYRLKLALLKEDFEPIKLDGEHINPACLNYLSNRQPIILNLPLAKGRSLPLYTLAKSSKHPYVVAVRKAVKSIAPFNTIKETLKEYYELYQPVSAAEILGLGETHPLSKEPYWAVTLPWNIDSVEQMKIRIQRSVTWENKVNGLKLTVEDGWAWAGPVSEKKLHIETERLYKIYNSILKHGYKRRDGSDGDIQAYVLMTENGEWIWQAQVGLHRASTVAGLNYETIPVRVNKIIYRSEVESWPNVRSGLYSKEDALKIFDMVFEGVYPAEASTWVNKTEFASAI